jgi:hypothetical protein
MRTPVAVWLFLIFPQLLAAGCRQSPLNTSGENEQGGGQVGDGPGGQEQGTGQGGAGPGGQGIGQGGAGPGGQGTGQGGGSITQIEGVHVQVSLGSSQAAEVNRLKLAVGQTASLTADALIAMRKVPFRKTLGYTPTAAVNLPIIQRSAHRLDDAELAALSKNGFAITKYTFPHFVYAYESIYAQDLPVFVSADSVLTAIHKSYDDILKAIETGFLIGELQALLSSMRGKLPTHAGIDELTRKDLDLFLAVAVALLNDKVPDPVAGADLAMVLDLHGRAKAAQDSAAMELFGLQRTLDLSQFKPRGHYAGIGQLERYFRAMMWLGRIDFPMLHTTDTGERVLVRRSIAAALAIRGLMDDATMARYRKMDQVIRAFVGEPDSMSPLEVDSLKMTLGVSGVDVSNVTDELLAKALVEGAYGQQKILSQIVTSPLHDETLPLDATFMFFGQRYVLDSHVFSNVVFDRVKPSGSPRRMLPDPLDIAYAALGNDQAASLLAGDLTKHKYAPNLEQMRILANEHSAAFWDANLYNAWLSSLRALSPGPGLTGEGGLPAVATTEAWGRRILNTQLASWSELRRNTILYAKQSYTSGAICEFPDAYVEPYPAFFARIEVFARKGAAALAALLPQGNAATLMSSYFHRLGEIAAILREMAEHQRSGLPHKAEHLAFINNIVRVQDLCGVKQAEGWYVDLFFDRSALKFDPVVADVHTSPTDEAGSPVGWVMHVGTGWTRMMVVTVDTCMGPRVYAGPVSSFHQKVTEGFKRLNDEEWAALFKPGTAPEIVPWMKDLTAAP